MTSIQEHCIPQALQMPVAMAGSNTAPHLRERRPDYYPMPEGVAEIFGWLRLDLPTMAGQ